MPMKKKRSHRAVQDPFAEREASKYERPIPSREFILKYLSDGGRAMTREELSEGLGLTSEDELEALRRRLRAMERDAQLIYSRRGYAPVDKLNLVRGRVIGHPDGFGFLVSDDGGDDLFLSARQMRALLHGDRALVHVIGVDRRGRREGALVEVLERNTVQVVGRYFEESGVGFVVPVNKRISHDVVIPPDARGEAHTGQMVVADLVEQPSKRAQPIGRVVEVLGEHMAPGMEIDVAARSHGLPSHWPVEVEEEMRAFGEEVPDAAKQGRVDVRHLPLVTIDGADARDFDDAVYAEATPKGWRLLVAIADVSHYVAPGNALDQEARERGNSVYFPERVIPMLPEALSNGLCSINPGVDRLCMVCEMQIDKAGKVVRSRFFEGVMRSHARLIYDDVAAMLVDGDRGLRDKYAALLPHLEELHGLYKVLRKARQKRGAIDFETTETRIVFGPDRKIERIVPVQRNDAHMLIEECMILANVCTARFLERHAIPALYRIHEGPNEDRLVELREFLSEFGLQLKGGDKPEPRHFADVVERARGRPDGHLIQTVLLRSLKQAQYSPDNIGHFGLAHEAYAHFTSPIRRYPDLLVHRAIRHILNTRALTAKRKAKGFRYTHEDMVSHGEHCSMTDRRADEATRDAVNWLKCEFMTDKVGETFEGTIAGVTSFGIFVELDDIYVEGLVHVTALGEDYFHFDPVGHRLTGERTRTSFRLGDRVEVRVMRVDLDERKIDFELLVDAGPVVAPGKPAGKPRRRGPGKTSGGAGKAKGKAPAPGAKARTKGTKPAGADGGGKARTPRTRKRRR